MRRLIALGTAAVALVVAAAAPVGAHSGSNASQRLRSVVVTVPGGLTARVAPDGTSITVTAVRPTVVIGYSGEPFLRLEEGRVLENGSSPTTYDVHGGVAATAPASAASAPAVWRRVDTSATYSWPDHRITWSGSELPAAVMSDPERRHVVTTWSIPVAVDGRPGAIEGRVDWVPSSDSALLTIVTPVAFLVVALAAALWIAFPRRRRVSGSAAG